MKSALLRAFKIEQQTRHSNGQIIGSFLGLGLFFVLTKLMTEQSPPLISVFFAIIFMSTLSLAPNVERAIANMLTALFCCTYGVIPWVAFWELYKMSPRPLVLFYLLIVVMLSDSGAYFVGKNFGKTRLAPQFSPKKSVEGAFGGILIGALGGFCVNEYANGALGSQWLVLGISVITAISGILGDLVESAIKRFADVKDSGTLLPGHGGFLDRVDGLICAAPVVWFAFYYLRG
jgi:phosphatidate cytidylyltransferase